MRLDMDSGISCIAAERGGGYETGGNEGSKQYPQSYPKARYSTSKVVSKVANEGQ